VSRRPTDDAPIGDHGAWLVESANEGAVTSSKAARSLLPTQTTRLTQVDDLLLSRLAREEADERSRRLKFLDKGLLGEPAWDILLDLYVNEATGLRASVGDACIAAGGSEATALRVIRMLEIKGFLDRTPDRRDRRRHWVTISPKGYEVMRQYLKARAVARMERPFIYQRPYHHRNIG
jgi:DNA-binding MarR family transcriptional regulator